MKRLFQFKDTLNFFNKPVPTWKYNMWKSHLIKMTNYLEVISSYLKKLLLINFMIPSVIKQCMFRQTLLQLKTRKQWAKLFIISGSKVCVWLISRSSSCRNLFLVVNHVSDSQIKVIQYFVTIPKSTVT